MLFDVGLIVGGADIVSLSGVAAADSRVCFGFIRLLNCFVNDISIYDIAIEDEEKDDGTDVDKVGTDVGA